MDLNWLLDFDALAESGNFSRAAESRHVTQPAFSRRIRALEDWAGTPLFERATQPVTLTEAGARVRPLLADIVRRLAEAREEAGAIATGTLRFAATHALSFSVFPTWLRALGPALPSVAIQLISDGQEACERLMLAGRADFLLCHHHEAAPGPLAGPDFEFVEIGRDRLCLVCKADDGHPRFRFGDTAAPMLGYGTGSGLARIVAAAAPRTPAASFTSHLAAVLRRMALDGDGIAWLPESLIAADLTGSALARADLGPADIPVEIRLVRRTAGGTRAGRAFWASLPPAAP